MRTSCNAEKANDNLEYCLDTQATFSGVYSSLLHVGYDVRQDVKGSAAEIPKAGGIRNRSKCKLCSP